MNEKPSIGKAVGMAALVGGIIGVIGHTLVVLFAFTPLYTQGLSIFLVLGTLGIIGAILFITGTYPKLEAIGGMGAMLPFCGLSAAVAGATMGAGKATGSLFKGAMTAIIELLVKIVLLGTAICCVISVVMLLTGFGVQYTVPYAPGGVVVDLVEGGPPMGIPVDFDPLYFLWSFLCVGALAGICQFILMITKVSVPVFFVAAFVLSGLLTPFGVIQALVKLTGGGFMVLLLGAGEAIVNTFFALLSGMPMPFLLVLCLFAFLFIIGITAGAIRMSMTKNEPAPPGGPEGPEE